jgi:prepilin-type N-terminal cleavage/methylation domain-containing protein
MELFMKYKVKAFTLIELIVVMAVVAIMMAAIMKFFEPIRMIYNDATFYEQRRSVTNSMVKYTTESIRYAKYLGIYSQNEVGVHTNDPGANAAAAASLFRTKMTAAPNSVTIPLTATINVIELDYHNNYDIAKYNNKFYYGRLYRSKFVGPVSPGTTPKNSHLAFGASYYGATDFYMQWAYKGGKFESFAASYKAVEAGSVDAGPSNRDGIVVRSVAAVNLKNMATAVDPGKADFTDTTPDDGSPDFTTDSSTLKTEGTEIPYGGMSAASPTSYYLVWIDADQFT